MLRVAFVLRSTEVIPEFFDLSLLINGWRSLLVLFPFLFVVVVLLLSLLFSVFLSLVSFSLFFTFSNFSFHFSFAAFLVAFRPSLFDS